VTVVGHDAIAAKSHRVTGYSFGNNLFEGKQVGLFAKYAKTGIRSIEQMINVSGQRCLFRMIHNDDG